MTKIISADTLPEPVITLLEKLNQDRDVCYISLKDDEKVVILSEDYFEEILEDLEDLRDALKAEKEYIAEGGKLFSDYDKERRRRRQIHSKISK